MPQGQQSPAVFTPSDEPYLGLPSLVWFDRIIVWAMRGNDGVAAHTHVNSATLSPLQRAACQTIPQGFSIALSIRELIRQAYLFPAMALMRPLIERAAVMSYLCAHPEAVALWHDGWKYGKRPKLAAMLEVMGGPSVDAEAAKKVCQAHSHIVHGDPIGSYANLVHLGDGRPAYSVGKMVDSPDVADTIAMEAQCYLVVLVGRMKEVFPQVHVPPMPTEPDATHAGV